MKNVQNPFKQLLFLCNSSKLISGNGYVLYYKNIILKTDNYLKLFKIDFKASKNLFIEMSTGQY